MLILVKILPKADYIIFPNYYMMHYTWRINDTTCIKKEAFFGAGDVAYILIYYKS